MIPTEDIDYVALYAERLRRDNTLFLQQKRFLDSQFRASRELFRNRFGTGERFKENARKYLKEIGLL